MRESTKARTWNGFDYRAGKPVTLPRSEWRRLIQSAHRRLRIKADQSLVLFDRIQGADRIVLEVYDRDPPEECPEVHKNPGEPP